MLNFHKNIYTTIIFTRRLYHKQRVRVRFAPSPTGYLHLGGLRTALYNHLFALSNNGQTILRIEDTDQDRKVPDAMIRLLEDLHWCGLGYDIGPIYQSTRLELYKTHVDILLAHKKAYRCFCSSTRLDLLRKEAIKLGQVPKYDNRCRSLSEDEIREKLSNNQKYCVRFQYPTDTLTYTDLVYKSIKPFTLSEGDFVILKTDGYPTYHLANVVDDHDMGITHVLRGVEWQTSTPKHILLYEAFEWMPPHFAHLPLLLNSDGSKLSKRQGDIDVKYFREQGVFPLALLNFVVRSGGGFAFEQQEKDHNIFTISELAQKFDLNKITGISGKVELEKLAATNQLELQRLLKSPNDCEHLISQVQMIVKCHFQHSDYDLSKIDTSAKTIERVLKWAQTRICYIKDLVSPEWRFLWVLPKVVTLSSKDQIIVAKLAIEIVDNSFEADDLKALLKDASQKMDIPFSALMKLLRSVLCGLKEGPGVVEMMTTLGKDIVIGRLRKASSGKP